MEKGSCVCKFRWSIASKLWINWPYFNSGWNCVCHVNHSIRFRVFIFHKLNPVWHKNPKHVNPANNKICIKNGEIFANHSSFERLIQGIQSGFIALGPPSNNRPAVKLEITDSVITFRLLIPNLKKKHNYQGERSTTTQKIIIFSHLMQWKYG